MQARLSTPSRNTEPGLLKSGAVYKSNSSRRIAAAESAVAERLRSRVDPLGVNGHNLLVYNCVREFSNLYSAYAEAHLPRDEIVLLSMHYETVDKVKDNLMRAGVDVERHLADGTLFVFDAQKGYFSGDVEGTFKLALSLADRARRENRRGVTLIGDMGPFYMVSNGVTRMILYELSRPKQYKGFMKSLCCYHRGDFERLDAVKRSSLLSHHATSILVADGQS